MPTANVNGVEICYEETGQGAPLVFSHEFGGDHRSWEPQARYFARRYRVVTYNHRGYPPSGVPKAASDYSQDLRPELGRAPAMSGRVVTIGGVTVRVVAGAVLLAALAGRGEARELVTLKLGDGVTQSYLLAVPAGGAQAVAILFPGGDGKFDLEAIAGRLKPARGNFLIRARGHFVDRGVATAAIDAPSDQPKGMSDEFRLGRRHATDVAAVVADLKARLPNTPVFLVGTSRGSVSAASVGARIGDAVAGVALTSSMFRATNPRSREPGPGLSRFDFGSLKVPVLLVHHREDGCASTPYAEAHLLSKRFPLVSVKGGLPPQSDPCQAMSAHGYLGKEVETVDAIVRWMVGKPYPREIE